MFSMKSIYFCNRRGVSLIELAVVIAITGFIAAIGIPQYSRFAAKNSVQRFASDLVQNIRLAKTIAEKEDREYLIVFDQVNNRYLFGFDGNGDGDLLDVTIDGFGTCQYDANNNGTIEETERTPANDQDLNLDGVPDCIRVVNLNDYGNYVAIGYQELDSIMPPNPPDPDYPPIPATGLDFPGNTIVFNNLGAVDSPGFIYLQHANTNSGYSYCVAVVGFAGGVSMWRWDGDAARPAVTTWTEVR